MNRQLFDDIRGAILAGQLSAGTRLPPTREVAKGLSIAHGIVVRPLSSYYADPLRAQNGLALGYGGVSEEQIPPAVARLAVAIESVGGA